MPLSVGSPIPEVTLTTIVDGAPTPISSTEALGTGKVVLFGVPGAFTPACSDQHLPGFVDSVDALRAKGVDRIACTAVNDAFVLNAWAGANEVGDGIMMLADGNGDFAEAAGLSLDGRDFGMGIRSQRYAAIISDGVVQELTVEDIPTSVEGSGADAVLAKL